MLGGGGITEAFLRLLRPFDCHVTVVRHHAQDMEGADVVLESDRLTDALPGADLVVVALALTPETEGIISATELEFMEPHSWIVNVARGRHIVTADLVQALEQGHHRRGRPRRHRPRAAARGPSALVVAQLHHHAARRATPRRWPGRCSPNGSPRT